MDIEFYSDRSHYSAVVESMRADKMKAAPLRHQSIRPPFLRGNKAVKSYRHIFEKLFERMLALGGEKVLFLSFDPECLLAIKQLKLRKRFRRIKVALVAHGLMEDLADDRPTERAIELPIKALRRRSYLQKVTQFDLLDLPGFLVRALTNFATSLVALQHQRTLGLNLREILELNHTHDYRYIFLAPHAAANAARYLDSSRFDLFVVTTPVALVPPRERVENGHVKFAVYGNADQLVFHNIAQALIARRPRAAYELKLVSSNQFGAEGLTNVQVVGKRGRKLHRTEMEKSVEDVDFLLFLSDKSRYRLSCSGVLFEAFSLVKPLIYFENECVDQFNIEEAPIGIRCESFEEYIKTLVDLIERFREHEQLIWSLREGVLRRRQMLQGEDVVAAIRMSFEW